MRLRYKLTARLRKTVSLSFTIEEPVTAGKTFCLGKNHRRFRQLPDASSHGASDRKSEVLHHLELLRNFLHQTQTGPNHLNASRFELNYKFRINRRITKVAILAEDSAGSVVTEELGFVTNPRRPKGNDPANLTENGSMGPVTTVRHPVTSPWFPSRQRPGSGGGHPGEKK